MKTGWLGRITILFLAIGAEMIEDLWIEGWMRSIGIWPSTTILDDLITGGFVGVVIILLLIKFDRAKEDERARARMIGEMNHHVRNALQAIEYGAHARERSAQIETIHAAVERIDWALREVLPSQCKERRHHPEQRESQVS